MAEQEVVIQNTKPEIKKIQKEGHIFFDFLLFLLCPVILQNKSTNIIFSKLNINFPTVFIIAITPNSYL